jgi:hypothetical protein
LTEVKSTTYLQARSRSDVALIDRSKEYHLSAG